MRDAIEGLVVLPMPLVGLLVLGLIFWRRRGLSAFAIGTATVLFVAFSLPGVATWLENGLRAGAPAYRAGIGHVPDMVLVPTAGSYTDPDGRLWPAAETIRRLVAGAELARAADLPLLVIGGRPKNEAEAEATTAVRLLPLDDLDLLTEVGARDSAETALAAKALVEHRGGSRVLLVTSDIHIARMAASLRHVGLEVVASGVRGLDSEARMAPGARAFGRSTAALREYVGLLWYLIDGSITFDDLRPTWPRGSRVALR